jgi:multidrug efflux pump subunit AcrA (membrane-fusion protein)
MFQKLKKRWYLVLLVIGLLIWGISRFSGNRDGEEKVAVGKAVSRTIIESVNASGKVYPEVEVKISPDIISVADNNFNVKIMLINYFKNRIQKFI